MAMNSKNTVKPNGEKFKVTVEREGKTDFVMLYAKNEEDALSKVKDAWKVTSWKPVKTERVINL